MKSPQETTDAINWDHAANMVKQQRALIESLNTVSDVGGLYKIEDSLSIKLDLNPMNCLSLSSNGLMSHGLKYPLAHDFNASNNQIYFVGDPIFPQDAVNKRYVDRQRVKNNVGFVPELYGTRTKNGFIVSTNTQLNNNTPAKSVFNEGGYEWSTAGLQENAWVQIELAFKVCIWRFSIGGKMSN